MQKEKLLNWLLFILLSFVWGSSFILMKMSNQEMNGVQIGAVRIFSAGLFFLPLAVFHFKKIPANRILLVALSGVLGNLLPAFLFAIAIEKIDSSLEGILNSLTPLFVIVLGIVFFKMPVARPKLLGVLIGFAGLVILSLSKGSIRLDNIGYALLIVFATICYGLNVNLVSRYLKGINPLHMATVSLTIMGMIAGLVLLTQGVAQSAIESSDFRTAMFYAALLGVVGSAVATLLFYILIKKAGPLFASLVTYGIPVVAIFWGFLAHENITWLQLTGLAVILSGVFLANKN